MTSAWSQESHRGHRAWHCWSEASPHSWDPPQQRAAQAGQAALTQRETGTV